MHNRSIQIGPPSRREIIRGTKAEQTKISQLAVKNLLGKADMKQEVET